jgi:D-alanyl-D-alanine carboxypeptidase
MHLKTGRLDDVSGIAGSVTADSGSRYTVAVLVNGPDAHRGLGEDLQEVVLDWVLAQ